MKSNKKQISKPNFRIDELALVLIVAVAAILAGAYDRTHNISGPDAEKITRLILDGNEVSFANNGVIDQNKLKDIQSMDYKDFKRSLNANYDFCIYIEDENGKVIFAKGASRLSKDGIICRE